MHTHTHPWNKSTEEEDGMAEDCGQMDPLGEIGGWHSGGKCVYVCVCKMVIRGTGGPEKLNDYWRAQTISTVKSTVEEKKDTEVE